LEVTYGVTSKVYDDCHVLIWDFDEAVLDHVVKILREIQEKHNLPTIYVLETSPHRFSALCLSYHLWEEAFLIVAWTNFVDENFLKMSLKQGYFTLRVGPKGGHTPILERVLKSAKEEALGSSVVRSTVEIDDLKTWYFYEPTQWPYRGIQQLVTDENMLRDMQLELKLILER